MAEEDQNHLPMWQLLTFKTFSPVSRNIGYLWSRYTIVYLSYLLWYLHQGYWIFTLMIMIITSLLLLFCCQVLALFPSSQGLEVIWSSVVKFGQSLYREGPGKDPFRPDQKTPIKNFFLAGSYTKQVTSTFLFHLRNAWLSNTDYILSLLPTMKKGGWVSTIPALLGREAVSASWKLIV